jgi:hypothetical protein
MTEWKISSGQDRCSSCEREFEVDQPYFSSIAVEPGGVMRRDFCTACFAPSENADAIFWRTRMPDRNVEQKKMVDFAVLRELFFKMVAQGDAGFAPMAYLVGLVLVRKKYLRLMDFLTRDGKDFMRVQRRRGEPHFDVEMPLLDAEGIDQLKTRLSDLLSADLGDDFDLSRLEDSEAEAGPEEAQGLEDTTC